MSNQRNLFTVRDGGKVTINNSFDGVGKGQSKTSPASVKLKHAEKKIIKDCGVLSHLL